MIAASKKGKLSIKTGISKRMSKKSKTVSKTECQKVNSSTIGIHIQRDSITLTWLYVVFSIFLENKATEWLTTSTMLCFHDTIISVTDFVKTCSLAIIIRPNNKTDIETNLIL